MFVQTLSQPLSESYSVTLRVPPSISGTESRIIKPLIAKRPGKKTEIKKPPKKLKKQKKKKKNKKRKKKMKK